MHYVQLALDNPGQEVVIEDHYHRVEGDRYLFGLVCNILKVLQVRFDPYYARFSLICHSPEHRLMDYPSANECMDAFHKECAEEVTRPSYHRNKIR